MFPFGTMISGVTTLENTKLRQHQIFGYMFVAYFSSCTTPKEIKHSGLVIKTDSKTCYHLTPENTLKPVIVCTEANDLTFRIGSQTYRYDLYQYRDGVKSFLSRYIATTSYSKEGLAVADIDLWLSSHWQNPERSEVVAVVKGPAGNFSFHFPIEPHLWQVPSQVSWLGKEVYPSRKALKLGFLEVKAKPGFSHRTLSDFMAETGIYGAHNKSHDPLVKTVAGQWPHVILAVEPFSEPKIARHLRAHIHAPLLIEDLTMPLDSQIDGAKAKFFWFRF
jgi:hypothetical protein